MVAVYVAAWTNRYQTPPTVDARDRRAVEELLEHPGRVADVAGALDAYLESDSPHWIGRGFPLEGLARDWKAWIVAGRRVVPVVPTCSSTPPKLDQVDQEEQARRAREVALEQARDRVEEDHDRENHVGQLRYCGRCEGKLQVLAPTTPATSTPVDAVVAAFRSERAARQLPSALVRESDRRALETTLRETGHDLVVMREAIAHYLDAPGHWARQGWPLRGLAEDIDRWTAGDEESRERTEAERRRPNRARQFYYPTNQDDL